MFLGDFRKVLWDVMENPYSSLTAKAFAVFSSLFVLISIVAMTINTVKELSPYQIAGRTYMEWIEISSILFFTLEYFLRLVTTSNIKSFVKSALNFVDVVAVMPYFIQLLFEAFIIDAEDISAQEDLKTMSRVSKVSKVLKVVKLMRIFRILKLARHSTGMRAFGFTIRQCSEQVWRQHTSTLTPTKKLINCEFLVMGHAQNNRKHTNIIILFYNKKRLCSRMVSHSNNYHHLF